MGSFASKSSLQYRQLPYLAACILTSTVIACASDDADSAASEDETQASETKSDAGGLDAAQAGSEGDEPIGPEASAEAQAARDEAANPGSAAVTRYDGDWEGKTSQDKPVSFKILNRFVAHAELSYAFEGDGDCGGEFKFSAMTPSRMGAFMLMQTNESAKLVLSGKFTGDDDAEGEFTVEAVGDAPEGCESSASGTWTATK